MINSDSLILTSGVILAVLISATIINYTTKTIFVAEKLRKPVNQIYDPDHVHDITNVCVFSKKPYAASYEKSSCFNKTLAQWYNPWLRSRLWAGFWSEIKARNRLKRVRKLQEMAVNKTESSPPNETVLPTDLKKGEQDASVPKEKKKPIEFVLSILVGLLIISGLVAFWEVIKDLLKRDDGAAAKARERQCSLADFTINRHLRKETQQQQTLSNLPRQGSLEITAKVTQNLIHQSSLDRAFPKTISEALTPLESRRNSVPSYLSSEVPAGAPSSPKFKSIKRQSVDVPEEIFSDMRKKPRHFIRRH